MNIECASEYAGRTIRELSKVVVGQDETIPMFSVPVPLKKELKDYEARLYLFCLDQL